MFCSFLCCCPEFLFPLGKMSASMMDMTEFGEAAEYLRKSYEEMMKYHTMPFDGKTCMYVYMLQTIKQLGDSATALDTIQVHKVNAIFLLNTQRPYMNDIIFAFRKGLIPMFASYIPSCANVSAEPAAFFQYHSPPTT